MFFVSDLERSITLHPSFMGHNVRPYLQAEVIRDVEGTIQGNHYVVVVMEDITFSDGRVIPGNGQVEYTAHYRALCWKPYKNEVVDGQVGNVVEAGFFVYIGPLEVFVSRAMIPPDMKFDGQASPPQWTNNEDQTVEKGTHVRIKLRSVKAGIGKISAIGTINEDFLGPIQ